uniref:Si:dkey-86e18.1 n=1 Tax=Sinocyclocheilus anshuiensis TaxID=1608454 RepID=A0A671Q3W4_9TELE
MARNEEKQFEKLNLLWLQKEREEGRIKDVHVSRPKLATLNSVAAVKKWMPSIKKEIEYYLQSLIILKIDEFCQHIEELETKYKRFLKKLCSLDPTCKHKHWETRAYAKRRQDPVSNQNTLHQEEAGNRISRTNIQELRTPSAAATTQASNPPDQDLPLCFGQSRLAVAVASSHVALAGQQQDTGTLTRVLLTGLPNLHSLPLAQTAAKEATRQSPSAETAQSKTEHLLGLGCYSSSSDEEI